MKKTLAITLVLVFVLSLAACGETYTLEGNWKAPASVLGFSTAYPDDCYVLLEFKADGSGKMTYVGIGFSAYPDDFSYVVNDGALIVTAENGEVSECEYEIEGNTLTISTGYRTVEYTRLSE